MITVILNCYKRAEYLKEQIEAIRNQSVAPEEIMIWSNRPEEGQQYNLDDLGVKVAYSNTNMKFHARFAYGLLAKTEYVAFFDDDTIPGKDWFKNCLACMKTGNYILGSAGVRLEGDAYDPCKKVGWNGYLSNQLEMVDLVGHAWFMKRDTLKYLWQEYPISWENGEDIQLSAFAYMNGGIETAVPPHPDFNKDLWGSIKGYEKGDDKNASHWKSNHAPLRNQICKELSDRGYKRVLKRK
tara:strand:- start:17189 stop:17908 length:720 start_codon:yes stop_codon:yes gene_type:complete